MADMELSKFEPQLRSKKNAAQNDYIERPTNLSDYVNAQPGINKIIINACSDDGDLPYTGFQIDKK